MPSRIQATASNGWPHTGCPSGTNLKTSTSPMYSSDFKALIQSLGHQLGIYDVNVLVHILLRSPWMRQILMNGTQCHLASSNNAYPPAQYNAIGRQLAYGQACPLERQTPSPPASHWVGRNKLSHGDGPAGQATGEEHSRRSGPDIQPSSSRSLTSLASPPLAPSFPPDRANDTQTLDPDDESDWELELDIPSLNATVPEARKYHPEEPDADTDGVIDENGDGIIWHSSAEQDEHSDASSGADPDEASFIHVDVFPVEMYFRSMSRRASGPVN